MFDGNPLTAKFHLQDLERQVAAARLTQADRRSSTGGVGAPERVAHLICWLRDWSLRAVVSAARGVAATIL